VLGGGSSSGGGARGAAAVLNAAKRKAAEEDWAAELAAIPSTGGAIRTVASKALELCAVIGAQKVVRAVLEQMNR
jgi:hypothetical protein